MFTINIKKGTQEMEYTISDNVNVALLKTDCLVVAVYQDKQLSTVAEALNVVSNNALSDFLDLGDFTGEVAQSAMLYHLPNICAKRLILVGCGQAEKFVDKVLQKVVNAAAKVLNTTNCVNATSFLVDDVDDKTYALQQSVIAYAASVYQCDQYKSKQADPASLQQLNFAFSNRVPASLNNSLSQAIAIAKGMDLAKDLANAPGNVCTPSYLADQAHELTAAYDALSIEVLEEADMQALGMGSFLSVSQGSKQAGKMIVMQYQGAAADTAPIALVGKGITFDTGGISLKPGAAMDEMKYDMGGAASVFGAVQACAEMALPINMVAVIASAENMPGSAASKPGDIVTSMSGQTIEVLNTDAEGRLVLCDALTYVDKYKPDAIIDIATLTGACIVALGHHISGLMSNDDALADEILAAGKYVADEVWRLPMSEDYQDQLKSNFADIPNIGNDRSAGTITAACFLSRFVEDKQWAHLDIAGTAWKSGAAKGSTGRPVPLLSQILINRAKR
jgi:leucyl aminopeptidase